ncbi:hypothetical protein TRICI_001601 [Trichomonascus ciferrii]|uniref:Uncharacterized protein n=1 Tax=Trichomonascus ciferrii TaxID=44093 RepID=A0A642V982_9ASCO|nr:hypothetical protein TRICI_001601 [Trichomonascus ciferrii]
MEYVQCLEGLVFSRYPEVDLPSIPDLKVLLGLAVVPDAMYSTAGMDFDTSDLNVSKRSLRLLERIHRAVRQNEEVRDAFYTVFIPHRVAMDTETITERLQRRHRAQNEDGDYRTLIGVGDDEDGSALKLEEKDDDDDLDSLRPSDYDDSDLDDGANDFGEGLREADFGPVLPELGDLPVRMFDTTEDIVDMIGWAFTCSTVPDPAYVKRWVQWRAFLEFLLDVLETNLACVGRDASIIQKWRELSEEVQLVTAIMTHVRRDHGKLEYSSYLVQEKMARSTFPDIDGARYDERASELRARFLDLLFQTTRDTDVLYSICRTYIGVDWSYRALIGHGPSDPHTLSRLAWCSILQGKQSTQKLALEYLLTPSPDLDLLLTALKAVPGRLNDFNKTNAPDLFKIILDVFSRFLSSHRNSEINGRLAEIKEAYRSGAEARRAWFKKKCDTPQVRKMEHVLESFVSSLSRE